MALSNVYVGNLPPHCTSSTLQQAFSAFGTIVSHKLMTDPATGQCKGFGFVNFADPQAAMGAVAAMNGNMLDGNALAVKLADRNPGSRGAAAPPGVMQGLGAPRQNVPSDNVFVGGIPPDWTEADLTTAFGASGPIVSSVVLMDKTTGRGRGAGLVRFASVTSAAQAVQTLNGSVVEGTGRRLEVRFADRPEDKTAKRAVQQVMQQLRYSPYGATMSPYGGVPSPYAGPASGLGNIRMPSVGPMSSGMFGGSAMTGPIKVPRRQDITPEEGSNLHVFGLDPNITDLHLYEAFAGYGAIRSVKVMKDPATQMSKGFGFVQFFNVQDAFSAISALNGLQVGSKAWSVTQHKKRG